MTAGEITAIDHAWTVAATITEDNGVERELVICRRPGCNEIGARIDGELVHQGEIAGHHFEDLIGPCRGGRQ